MILVRGVRTSRRIPPISSYVEGIMPTTIRTRTFLVVIFSFSFILLFPELTLDYLFTHNIAI
jgi:hypothetical protein